MITFPCAKINLGLNVVATRPDGYHDIETVFYPIPLHDTLEVKLMDERFPSELDCDLKVTGDVIEGCCEADNIVVKAYNLLRKNYRMPRVHAHLYKHIPSQAGLGGGSADAKYRQRRDGTLRRTARRRLCILHICRTSLCYRHRRYSITSRLT